MENGKQVTRLRDLKVDGVRDMPSIDPRVIVVEPGFNPRNFNLPGAREKFEALKASIKAEGVQQPLWIRWTDNTPYLVAGERRLRACLELIAEGHEIIGVPVVQKSSHQVNDPGNRLIMALTENESAPFEDVEVGSAYIRLLNYGWSPERIAERTGKPIRYVNDMVELAGAPDAVKAMVSQGEVTAAAAVSEMKHNPIAAVENLKSKVKAAGGKPVTREKAQPVTKLEKAVNKVLEEFTGSNAMDENWIAISRKNLIALRNALPKREAVA